MPIDSSRYSNPNFAHSYSNKYQEVAPDNRSSQDSWSTYPSGSSGGYALLSNSKARDLNAEMHLAGAALNPKNPKGQLVNLKESKDLKILERPTSLNKFVLTQDGNMVVGNIDKSVPPKWMSHPSIAEIGAGPGQSQNVVSAGYMKKNLMGKVQLSNTSGHYLPSKSDLRPAQQHLRNMGTESTKSECVIA